jgi:hypothetical protein
MFGLSDDSLAELSLPRTRTTSHFDRFGDDGTVALPGCPLAMSNKPEVARIVVELR